MCVICRGELKGDETELDVSNCKTLTNIPILPNLIYLYCSKCPLLTSIPILPNLIRLDCFKCPKLINIPILNNLIYLDCNNCHLLTNIPILNNLISVDCSSCNLLIEVPVATCICIDNCVWLNNNKRRKRQIKKLIKLQRIVKRYLNRKKFIIRLELNKYLPLVLIDLIKN